MEKIAHITRKVILTFKRIQDYGNLSLTVLENTTLRKFWRYFKKR
jgi:hypothetical protein